MRLTTFIPSSKVFASRSNDEAEGSGVSEIFVYSQSADCHQSLRPFLRTGRAVAYHPSSPLCGKHFKHASSLLAHKLTQSETRKWVCEVCPKTFQVLVQSLAAPEAACSRQVNALHNV